MTANVQVTCHLHAPRSSVYSALLDPSAIARWKVPEGMSCHVHAFEPREGGRIRVTLTYDASPGQGKTTAHADTYCGHFVELVPNEKIVDAIEFETAHRHFFA